MATVNRATSSKSHPGALSSSSARGVDHASGASPTTFAADAASDVATLHWHAVWTRYRHEPLVCRELTTKGIETFLPTITHVTKWSDRIKRAERPLFPGYCFARFAEAVLPRVLAGAGVVAVLSNGGHPATIPVEEIEALQRLVASGLRYDPCSALVAGSRVRVVNGPLAGIVGLLERRGGQDALILVVELLNAGTRVQVSAWDVEPL